MRACLPVLVAFSVSVQFTAAQQPSRDEVYRGPLVLSRKAVFIEPTNGVPLAFSNSVLTNDYEVRTTIRSRSIRSIRASGITLRLAFGPTANGMITFRLRAVDRAPEPPIRIAPDTPPAAAPVSVTFRIVPEDPFPGALALRPKDRVVFTVERIESEGGPPIFENPDATELLWESLGRPPLSSQ
jgi:hypothetical protein